VEKSNRTILIKNYAKKIIPNNVRDILFHYYNCSQNEAFSIPQINEAICNKMSEW
jgi:hypothetical protein